ncbi:MAG: hypothetical protein J0H46_07295 [Bacteroidetes bacterium]|nr:hypothetical protein [Bacteroidota bacterium]
MSAIDENKNLVENAIVNPKTINVYSAFAVILKRIHIRLVAEGYIIKDGQKTKSERLLAYEQSNKPTRKNR